MPSGGRSRGSGNKAVSVFTTCLACFKHSVNAAYWWWWWTFPSDKEGGAKECCGRWQWSPLTVVLASVEVAHMEVDKCLDCPSQRWSFPEPTVETSGGNLISWAQQRLCVRWKLLLGVWNSLKLKHLEEKEVCPLIEWELQRSGEPDKFELPSRAFQLRPLHVCF